MKLHNQYRYKYQWFKNLNNLYKYKNNLSFKDQDKM